MAVLLLLDGSTLEVKAAVGMEKACLNCTSVALGTGISGRVAMRGQPRLVVDVARELNPRELGHETWYTGSMLSAPLSFRDNLIGVLNASGRKQPFTRDELLHFASFAENSAFAIQSMRLVEDRTKELRRREAQLEESEKRYRLIADNVIDVVWTTDLRGAFQYVSPSLRGLTGHTHEDLRGTLTDSIVMEQDQPVLHDAIHELATSSRGAVSGAPPLRVRVVRRDGSFLWTESILSALRGPSGEVVGVVGVTRDASSRIADEARMRELNGKLVEASRRAGKAEVATGVLHNVGNVLNSLNIALSIVRQRVEKLKTGSVMKASQLLQEHEDELRHFSPWTNEDGECRSCWEHSAAVCKTTRTRSSTRRQHATST